MPETRVEDIYSHVKDMAVGYHLRPGDRVNEGALARRFGVSRTPLREALNRLVAEKMIDLRPGIGFFGRPLEAQMVFDLYELRRILETGAVRLACERASDADLQALRQTLYATGIEVSGLTVAEACARDEAFHMAIAHSGGNAALALQLQQVNERIRYIRWVRLSMGQLRGSKVEHISIMNALLDRDTARAEAVIETHIGKRLDEVTEAVREGITTIYMDQSQGLCDHVIQEEET